jgi:protein involved in polysaccharide export with SLBB domain
VRPGFRVSPAAARFSFAVYLVLAILGAIFGAAVPMNAQSPSVPEQQVPCVPTPAASCPDADQMDQSYPPMNPDSSANSPDQTTAAPYQQRGDGTPDSTGRGPDGSRTSTNTPYNDRSGNGRAQQSAEREQSMLQPPDPLTDFQRLAASSTGEMLPIFGRDLFRLVPSTFAPGDQIPVTPEYAIGPGDEILLRIWGPESFNGQLTVDRAGSIYIPKVGTVHVAGLRFDELKQQIQTEVGRVYRNFDLSVNLGRLRSVQVYVVGEARHPGAYTVSALSTVLNALFASGGPNVQGSLRHIQVRRTGQPVAEFDLYDLVLRGDKSKDIGLETGDTIFIPAVGPQVAVAGSVRHPAIYELSSASTLEDVLELAGGLSPTASGTQVSVERIQADHTRNAMSVALNVSGKQMALRDGDVIFVSHISAGYEKTVSIRGNLANPGRFPWHEGMKLSEIIPDKMSLLTTGYWDERNRLGIPVPLFRPAERLDGSSQSYYSYQYTRSAPSAAYSYSGIYPDAGDGADEGKGQPPSYPGANNQTAISVRDADTKQSGIPVAGASADAAPDSSQDRTMKRNQIKLPAPEIDWSYAVIERLDTKELRSVLIPFNLGRLVQDHDPAQDLELRPGDIVTILSQKDVLVPREEQTKYIRLEGEFVSAGVYSVRPGETLADVVRRAGGLTSKAYLYGSNFTRESARIFQQQRLDEYISSLSADMERAIASRSVASSTGATDPTSLAEQRLLISQLRQLRATGRVVLEFTPESSGTGTIPNLALEDGDVFRVPPTPSTVSVVGAVYGQNVFLYSQSRRLSDYVALAGKPNRIADPKHAFIIRADGSIYSRERAQGSFSNRFDATRINPGDSIVIPEKLIKPPVLRQLADYSQILSSFGLAAAAIDVIR